MRPQSQAQWHQGQRGGMSQMMPHVMMQQQERPDMMMQGQPMQQMQQAVVMQAPQQPVYQTVSQPVAGRPASRSQRDCGVLCGVVR